MTQRPDHLDRTLAGWLHDEVDDASARYVEETLARIAATPQRRWRGAILRALPEIQPVVVPRAMVVFATLGLLAAAIGAAAVLIGSRPDRPAPFGLAANGRIAYDDGTHVYVAESDGSQAMRINGGRRFAYSPGYSPDGRLVAFWSSNSSTGGSLFVASADGSDEARHIGRGTLLSGPPDVPPAWAPDSRSIAYPGWSPDGRTGIFVASIETGEARYVAGAGFGDYAASTEDIGAGFPVWSPDGRWIAYRTCCEGRTRLMLVPAEGGEPRELTSVEGDVEDAFTQIAWAPDAGSLVYHRPQDDRMVVAIYDLEDGERVISRPDRDTGAPTWSTDGAYIAYFEEPPEAADDGAQHELVVVSVDGAEHARLGSAAGCLPVWSPDSRYVIALASDCHSDQVVIVPIDGGPIRQMSLPGSMVGVPAWQRVVPPP